jgi:hypothetical protein
MTDLSPTIVNRFMNMSMKTKIATAKIVVLDLGSASANQ